MAQEITQYPDRVVAREAARISMLEQEVDGAYTPQEYRGKPELQKRRIFESGIIGQRQRDPQAQMEGGMNVLRQKAAFVREANRRGLGTYRYPKLANLFGIADFDVAGKGPLRSAAAIEAEIVEPSQSIGQPEATRFPISSAPATGTLVVPPPTTAQATPTNLWEFYTQRGQGLPSIQERSTLYESLGVGPASSYLAAGADNAAENQALLGALLAEERKAFPDRRVERTPIPQTLRVPTGQEDIKITEDISTTVPEAQAYSDARAFYEAESQRSNQRYRDIEKAMREAIETRGTERGAEVARLEEQYKVSANQARLDEILALVGAETAAYAETRQNLQAETLPEGLSRGHLQKIARDNLYKMEILQAEAKALQGQLSTADQRIDRALDLKFFTDAQFLSNLNSQLNRMEREGTADEKRRAEIMKEATKRQEAELKERKDMEKDVAIFFANNAEAFRQAGVSMDEAITMGLTRATQAATPFLAAQERRDIRGQEALIAGREDRGATPSPGFSDINTEFNFREALFQQKSGFTDYANPTEDEAFEATIRLRDKFAPSEVSDEAIKAAVGGPLSSRQVDETQTSESQPGGFAAWAPSAYEAAQDLLGIFD